jgi:Zn-dependent protease with chaperone function
MAGSKFGLTLFVSILWATTVLTGCRSPQELGMRASTTTEAAKVSDALMPLLAALDYPVNGTPPVLTGTCKVGLVIAPAPWVNAGARPGTASPCVYFGLFVTEGAVQKLPVPQLRALLAHELGHVHLGHFESRRLRASGIGPANWPIVGLLYERDDELAADDFAVRLLRRLEDRYPDACMALASLFQALTAQGGYDAAWLTVHPSPDRRAERAQASCRAAR